MWTTTPDFFKEDEETRKERDRNSGKMAESYFELVTDFYEFGYGKCFHFAPAYAGKSNEECIELYHKTIARALNVKPGGLVLVSPLVEIQMPLCANDNVICYSVDLFWILGAFYKRVHFLNCSVRFRNQRMREN